MPPDAKGGAHVPPQRADVGAGGAVHPRVHVDELAVAANLPEIEGVDGHLARRNFHVLAGPH